MPLLAVGLRPAPEGVRVGFGGLEGVGGRDRLRGLPVRPPAQPRLERGDAEQEEQGGVQGEGAQRGVGAPRARGREPEACRERRE
jgi:hypothetical protein